MRVNLATALVMAVGANAALTSTQVVENIKEVTKESTDVNGVAKSITFSNVFDKGPLVVEGFKNIISMVSKDISAMGIKRRSINIFPDEENAKPAERSATDKRQDDAADPEKDDDTPAAKRGTTNKRQHGNAESGGASGSGGGGAGGADGTEATGSGGGGAGGADGTEASGSGRGDAGGADGTRTKGGDGREASGSGRGGPGAIGAGGAARGAPATNRRTANKRQDDGPNKQYSEGEAAEEPEMRRRAGKKRQSLGYPDVEQSEICDAFRTFVNVHQALLSTVISKHGLLSQAQFSQPIAAVLRQLEAAVDTLAFGIIDLVPTCAEGATADKKRLDETLARAEKIYSN